MSVQILEEEIVAFKKWQEEKEQENKKNEEHRLKSLCPYSLDKMHLIWVFTTLSIALQNTGKATCMFRIYGHTRSMVFELYLNGWHTGKPCDFEMTVYYIETDVNAIKATLHEKIKEMDLLPIEQLNNIIYNINH